MTFGKRLRWLTRRAATGPFAAGALAALAACGGGSTYQQKAFVPARILVFGDENSRLEGSQGLKYSINGISTSSSDTDCTAQPIWTQAVATSYGLVFSNCNPNASFATEAIDHTVVNGTVQDVVNQVAAFQAGDTFNGNDLVLIWVGMHDILDDYEANGAGDETVLSNDMRSSGATLAGVVNAAVAAGAKVLLLTVPDMSQSPFAYLEAQRGDFDRLKLLSDMSTNFNLGLRTHIVNDSSEIGLVEVDTIVRNDIEGPTRYGLVPDDGQAIGCIAAAPLPTCTNDTLNADPAMGQTATPGFLWADATHLGWIAQNQIGTEATHRAHDNPF